MKEYELPLLEIFSRLQKAGLPLGIDEYQLVLRALQAGFGIPDKAALARLCCTLWVKSSEEKLLFDYHFERVMAEEALALASANVTVETAISPEITSKEKSKTGFLKIPHLSRYLILGSALTLAAGMIVALVYSLMNRCPAFTSQPRENAIVNQQYIYNITATACKANQNDTLKITAIEKPYWLNLEDKGNGNATLKGRPTSTRYRSIDLRDVDGNLLAKLPYSERISSISFSPDGKRLATASSNTHPYYTVRVWDISSRRIFKPFQYKASIESIKFSIDGQYIVATLGDRSVSLQDILGKFPPVVLWHKGEVTSVDFSSDKRYIATSSGDGTARVWNFKGNEIKRLWHKGRVLKVSLSPDKSYLVTNSEDGKSSLWELSGKLVREFQRQGKSGNVAFTPDGQRLINTSEKNTVSVWDISGKQVAKLEHSNSVSNFNLSPDGKYIVTIANNQATLWETSGKKVKEFNLGQESYPRVIFSADGKLLAVISYYSVHVWDIFAGKQIKEINTDFRDVDLYPVSFSPDSKLMAIASISSSQNVVLQVTDAAGRKRSQEFMITTENSAPEVPRDRIDIIYVMVGGLIILILLFGGYIVFRRLVKDNEDRDIPEESQKKEPAESPTNSPLSSELTTQLEDEIQVAKAVRQEVRKEPDTYLSSFSASNEYFPVTRRQMKQSWRYLRRLVREGVPTEFDIDATTEQIARQGVLLKPVFVPRRVNRTELIILIDQDGSMAPFHALSRRLAETAVQGGRIGKSSIYYFHNCPSQYLYNDPNHQQAKPIRDIFAQVNSKHTKVLIISDAGAARGGLNPDRVELTAAFLNYLGQRVRYIAWLNPLPRARWQSTSAGEISSLVPMFEFSRRGLDAAIGVLRGQLIVSEVL